MAQAWNLYFEHQDGVAPTPTTDDAAEVRPRPSAAPDGWLDGSGPAIAWENWPRSAATGLPMHHVLSLRLPVEYQRKGPGFPGIAFYAGDGQFAGDQPAVVAEAGSEDAFLADLANAVPHPQFQLRKDILGGSFGLIWLTEEELAGGPIAPKADLRAEGEHQDWSEGTNAWANKHPLAHIWLIPREDPNAGLVPQDLFSGDEPVGKFTNPWTEDDTLHPWAEAAFGVSHLGGTSFPVQELPEGLTAFYLELEEMGGLNFGGDGSAQIDLQSDTFDWACG